MNRHQGCAFILLSALAASRLQAADAVPAAVVARFDCPAESPGAGIAGDVVLQYYGGAGRATDIRIVRSSGVAALDKAAVLALARCKIPNGEAVTATVQYRFGGEAADTRPVLAEAGAAPATAADVHR